MKEVLPGTLVVSGELFVDVDLAIPFVPTYNFFSTGVATFGVTGDCFGVDTFIEFDLLDKRDIVEASLLGDGFGVPYTTLGCTLSGVLTGDEGGEGEFVFPLLPNFGGATEGHFFTGEVPLMQRYHNGEDIGTQKANTGKEEKVHKIRKRENKFSETIKLKMRILSSR